MGLTGKIINRLYLNLCVVLIFSFAVPVCMAGDKSKKPEIYKKEYRLRYYDPAVARSIRTTVNDAFKSKISDFVRKITDKPGKKNTYVLVEWGRKFTYIGNEREHKKVEKAIKKAAGKMLQPENLYDLDSVATIDDFADNVRKIVEKFFRRQKFSFLTNGDIELIADDIGEFVKTYTRSDVPKEMQLRILNCLGLHMENGYMFGSYNLAGREKIYRNFDRRFKSLKFKLWQLIAKEPLTDEEKKTFAEQKKWIYDLPDQFPNLSERTKIYLMLRMDRVFDDVLNGFSTQPMDEEAFEKFKRKVMAQKMLHNRISVASCWSTENGIDRFKKDKEKGIKWEFTFGVIEACGGGNDYPSYHFERKGANLFERFQLLFINAPKDRYRCYAYDISSAEKLRLPSGVNSGDEFIEWMSKEKKGDFYYDVHRGSFVCCRESRMAVLDVNNFIESDKISTKRLIEKINAEPITEFGLSGYESLDEISDGKPRVPMLAIESKTGEVAVVRIRGTLKSLPRELDLIIQHRSDGWEKLWFGSFITGRLKETVN